MKTSTNLRCGGYPGGSYTQTCRDEDYDQDSSLLKAACRQRNGAYNWTEMYVPDDYDDIVNCDGELALNYRW
jgi:hypothetical protein